MKECVGWILCHKTDTGISLEVGDFLKANALIFFLFYIFSEKPRKEHRKSSPVHPVVLPPNLHLLTLSIPGWNFSSNHSVHLSYVNSGQLRDKPSCFKKIYIYII